MTSAHPLRFTCRLSAAEAEALDDLARRLGVSRADAVRLAIQEKARQQQLVVDEAASDEIVFRFELVP
ncbi:MAG: CopG family transcriptional regulator [Alphaproteobacteria bacterium]|nr:CopG family transcriptional regulator [Alphaproteobacteria bacterium]